MERTIHIENHGEVVTTEVEPITSDEKWNEYQMHNGDILRVKIVLTRVFVAPDNITNKDGSRIYSVDFQPIVRAKPSS